MLDNHFKFVSPVTVQALHSLLLCQHRFIYHAISLFLQDSPSFHSAHSSVNGSPNAQPSRDIHKKLRLLAVKLQQTSENTQQELGEVFNDIHELEEQLENNPAGIVSE